MQACNGTVFWTYNFCINRRWFKIILLIPTKSSNSDLLLKFVAFRISREVNPVPAIANFTDLNQEVFLLAAYGPVIGLFYGCCCCTFVFCFFTVYLRSNNYWRWVWYKRICRSRSELSTEAEGSTRLMITASDSEICIILFIENWIVG